MPEVAARGKHRLKRVRTASRAARAVAGAAVKTQAMVAKFHRAEPVANVADGVLVKFDPPARRGVWWRVFLCG